MVSPNLERLKALTKKLSCKELELSETKDLLKSFFKMSLDLLSIIAIDGTFVKTNPAWETTLGWTLKELRSKPFMKFIHPEDRLKIKGKIAKLLKSNDLCHFKSRCLCKDGSYRVLCWTVCLSEDKKHIFGIARDFIQMMEVCND